MVEYIVGIITGVALCWGYAGLMSRWLEHRRKRDERMGLW